MDFPPWQETVTQPAASDLLAAVLDCVTEYLFFPWVFFLFLFQLLHHSN